MRTLVWAGLVAGLSAIGLAGCAEPHDPGGRRVDREEAISLYEATNTFREKDGICSSACTLELSLYRSGLVCVHSNARFRFHGVMWDADPGPGVDPVPYYGDRKDARDRNILKFYPPNLAKWFWETGRWAMGEHNFEELTGQQIHDMDGGLIPLCD